MSGTKLKQAKIYLLWVISAFDIGFIITVATICFHIYYMSFDSPLPPFLYGAMGGYCLAGIAAGVILFVRFIANKPEGLKIICIVLFLLTFAISGVVGLVAWIPYTCYYMIYLNKYYKKIKEAA